MPVIKRHQTLLDFATQWTGSVQGLLQVALLNSLSLTEDVAGGTDLKPGDVIDLKQSTYTTGEEIATSGRITGPAQPEGISIWAINLDFQIS